MKNFILPIFICFTTISSFSQTSIKQSESSLLDKEDWKPINQFPVENPANQTVNKAPTYSNILNGVTFYAKESVCNSENITVLKLINANNYPVKVAWQLSLKHPIIFVIVPANVTIEGECFVNNNGKIDENKSKLLLKLIPDTENDGIPKRLLSNVTVTELK